MARPIFRRGDCPDLLLFEEVRRRLGLGTRLGVGRCEVAVADIIGSVGRVADFDGCFRPRNAKLRREILARREDPAVIDMPIALLQVDHAYFVEDGHKRLSMVIADGRREVEADVDRFRTDLHLARGATMESIRATARERRFRIVTGLATAYPRKRFALSDPDGYLELEESVKSHTLDFSRAEGRLVPSDEGARHWYETVFRPVLDLIDTTDAGRLLESMTDGDRFLLFRRGLVGPMEHGWRIPQRAAERGIKNVRDRSQVAWSKRLVPLPRRQARHAPLLPEESDADGGSSGS
ncbi:MAG TPA: hypothetical protein VGQ89_06810 [Candidatus Limnocylindrales bacterium]|jgi:hypothetical protein|nr:hypothetical protein [Candidatus Limnocylindrales bacterium]